jgi:hypothetical protein
MEKRSDAVEGEKGNGRFPDAEINMNVRRVIYSGLLLGICGVCGFTLLYATRNQERMSRAGLGFKVGNLATSPKKPKALPLAGVPNLEPTNKPGAVSHYRWKIGGTSPDGNMVFADWEQGHLSLLSDYGFMLINEGTYEHPKAVFLLGYRQQKRITSFRSFAGFKQALKGIPSGTQVYLHTVCTSGTAPGVDEKIWKAVGNAFQKAHLLFNADDHVMYCICGEGADPYPNVPAELKTAYVRLYGRASFDAHSGGAQKPTEQ